MKQTYVYSQSPLETGNMPISPLPVLSHPDYVSSATRGVWFDDYQEWVSCSFAHLTNDMSTTAKVGKHSFRGVMSITYDLLHSFTIVITIHKTLYYSGILSVDWK